MAFTEVDGAAAPVEVKLDGNMNLPIKIPFELMLTKWSSILNPVIANPLNDVSILKNISLIVGETKIPHLLGRKQQGWFIVDINAAATIYRSKVFEDNFLYLTSNASVVVNLGIF